MQGLKHLKTKKGRDESGLFIIEGEKFVQEIPGDWQVVQYVAAKRYANVNSLSQYENRAKCEVVRDSIFDSLADTVSPQGILAVCEKKTQNLNELLTKGGFFLLGEALNDPGNIGALIRTAAAAGASAAIFTAGSGDVYNPKVLRAAAGAAFRLPIVENGDLMQIIEALKQTKILVYAAHTRGNILPYDLYLSENFCLLVGNESHGISDTAKNLADKLVSLPMANNTESLNASVAGSILLYEAVRQRRGGII